MSAVAQPSLDEAIELGAIDSIFYSQYWFPNTCRQDSPEFHRTLWHLFEGNRYANAEIFRGGSKTTITRLFTSKRIAYGISHTILFIGPNQDHAAKSVEWVMQQVEYNTEWAQAFGLRRGKKWTNVDCEIYHRKLSYPIRLMALGITGSVRGINIGDYRPDLIVVDDPCDEENTATPEQRGKATDLFFGAIKESLTPESEDPTAALILLQTPLHEDDLSAVCYASPEFASLRVGILTSEDWDRAESAWPARWTKGILLKEKEAAEGRNQLSLWMREKMCLIVSRETSLFLEEWLQEWVVLPPSATYVMAIDPAPIKSDKARMTGQKTDEQAVMVKCYWRGSVYVVEYETAEDEDPDQLGMHMNRLLRKYAIIRCGVEGVAYQRMLKWFIEREQKAGRIKSIPIMELPAVKSKHDRIQQAHTGVASRGELFIHENHHKFRDQFRGFPNIKLKDLLDVSAMCDATLTPRAMGVIAPDSLAVVDESEIKPLGWDRPAP